MGTMARLVAQIPVQHHPVNQRGRDFVVGDLHGCLDLLWRLLKHVHFDPEIDRVWSVGDLTDRGPQSWGCLRLLKQPWFKAVLGNHDALLLAHLRQPLEVRPHDERWLAGISPNMAARKAFAKVWIEVLEKLPAVHVIGAGTEGRFQVVHAELLNPGGAMVTDAMIDSWAFTDRAKALESATYGRTLIRSWREGRPMRRPQDPRMSPIFCGHTIVPQTCWLERQLFVDMGAFLVHTQEVDEGENALDAEVPQPGLVLVQSDTLEAWLASARKPETVTALTLGTLDTV